MRTSNRLVWTVIFVIGLTLQPAFGQPTGNKQRQVLARLGITPYPSEEEVKDGVFSPDGFEVAPLSTEDIHADFSNIEDLTWLEPIAKEHRVVLVGENHYYQYTQHLRNRILFTLNTFDSYSTLILERQYSKTPFLNHYLSLPDEEEARQFLQQIHEFFLDTSEVQLLHHLRRWNEMYPDKKIHVGCSDVELDYSLTFQQILRPYCLHLKRLYVMNGEHFPGCVTFVFHKLEQLFETRSIHSSEELNTAFQPLENVLILAKKRGFVGEYPFLTPEYIETVIENLKSTYKAKNFDFHTYRQQAIIRNLTDVRYLGNPFSTGKVMIHGGGHHTPTHYPYPEGQNFLREGSYLTYEFPLTKGRTYSLEIKGFAFSAILPVKSINLMECCTHLGSAYRKIVRHLQQADRQGLLTPEGAYVVEPKKSDEAVESTSFDAFTKILIQLASQYHQQPLLLKTIPWPTLIEQSRQGNPEDYQSVMKAWEMIQRYDTIILIPLSPLVMPYK